MRNFLKRSPKRKQNTRISSNVIGRRFLQEILDSDEDRVTNRYTIYREYVNALRKGIFRPTPASNF